jgi:predicted Zn-dependent protease
MRTTRLPTLRTHPLSGERMSDMQNREQPVAYRQVADSPDFQLVRARVRALQGRPVDAVREFETFLARPEIQLRGGHALRTGGGFRATATGAAAEQELAAVRKLKVSSAMVDRQLAEVKMGRGDKEAGLTLYREAMVRYPLNLAVLYGYGNTLIAEKQFSPQPSSLPTSSCRTTLRMRVSTSCGLIPMPVSGVVRSIIWRWPN